MFALQDGFSWNYHNWAYDVAKFKTLEKLKFYKKTFLPDYCIFPISHIVFIHMHIFIHEGKNGNNNIQETNTCFWKKYLIPPSTTFALIDVPGIILSNVCVWVWFFWKGEMYGMNSELMYYWWRCIPYCKDINLGIVMYLTIYIFYVHKNKFTNAHSYSLTHTYTSKCKYLPFVQPRETTINATNF